MKIFQSVEIPARTEERLVKRKCDLCGLESTTSDWDAGCYDTRETEIKVQVRQKGGSSYPEGGWGKQYEIDLCPACFKNRLVPWLRSQGAVITEEEWDY